LENCGLRTSASSPDANLYKAGLVASSLLTTEFWNEQQLNLLLDEEKDALQIVVNFCKPRLARYFRVHSGPALTGAITNPLDPEWSSIDTNQSDITANIFTPFGLTDSYWSHYTNTNWKTHVSPFTFYQQNGSDVSFWKVSVKVLRSTTGTTTPNLETGGPPIYLEDYTPGTSWVNALKNAELPTYVDGDVVPSESVSDFSIFKYHIGGYGYHTSSLISKVIREGYLKVDANISGSSRHFDLMINFSTLPDDIYWTVAIDQVDMPTVNDFKFL